MLPESTQNWPKYSKIWHSWERMPIWPTPKTTQWNLFRMQTWGMVTNVTRIVTHLVHVFELTHSINVAQHIRRHCTHTHTCMHKLKQHIRTAIDSPINVGINITLFKYIIEKLLRNHCGFHMFNNDQINCVQYSLKQIYFFGKF